MASLIYSTFPALKEYFSRLETGTRSPGAEKKDADMDTAAIRTQYSKSIPLLLIAAACLAGGAHAQAKADATMGFFITSVGSGKGANLGGRAGADAHCQKLAEAVGAGARTWHAYLSTQARDGGTESHAKDRIGAGPWNNSKGVQVAASVADLHSKANKLSKENSLTEKGTVVNGRGDSPNQHDILTGTHADGTAYAATEDMTCGNWTSEATGKAILGHHDRHGVASNIDSTSWVEAHASNGCSQANLVGTGGNGYFYCFAADVPSSRLGSGARLPGRTVSGLSLLWDGAQGPIWRGDLASPTDLSLEILTLSGIRVATLDAGMLPAGPREIHWDGRTSDGRPAPRGFFLIRVTQH